MKSWMEFESEVPTLAQLGKRMLFRPDTCVGYAFLATLRKDGAPRLHPISLVFALDRVFVLIPPTSPKCADLLRDGRFALQAFPPPQNEAGEEFYLSGAAACIQDSAVRLSILAETSVHVEENEVLLELMLERAMYTRLEQLGTPKEHSRHLIWKATS